MKLKTFIKKWRFTLILLLAVTTGALLGYIIGPKAEILKPLGDIFLNLLFTAVIPLVFFSLSSAIASNDSLKRLGKIASAMLIVFVITAIISSVIMLSTVKIFDPAKNLHIELSQPQATETTDISTKIVNSIAVNDFANLLNRRNILALIIFSILIGLASQAAAEKGRHFRQFLISGSEVMTHLIKLIMLYAPIGLGAYFAYLIGVFGPQIIGSYARIVAIYYPVAILYFIVAFSFYAIIANGTTGLRSFWTNIPTPALTALATGSSLAALPANLDAAKKIGIKEDIREIVLPIGATIHMDGSCLAAILKIAVLFSIFSRDFSNPTTMASAVLVSILCGLVMSGIPGGGFLGETLIVSLYGFPPQALPIISMLGTLIDPPATMINSTGDTVAAMIVNKFLNKKQRPDYETK